MVRKALPLFPETAKTALSNTQLRRNLSKATTTIRAKRAAVVGEQLTAHVADSPDLSKTLKSLHSPHEILYSREMTRAAASAESTFPLASTGHVNSATALAIYS